MKRGLRNTIKSAFGLCNAKCCYKPREYQADINNPVTGECVMYVDLCDEHMNLFAKRFVSEKSGDEE